MKNRVTRAAVGSLVGAAGALVALPATTAQAATCTPAGATGLTAAVIATAGQTISNQTIDATGCDVGIYIGPTASGVTITGSTVSNANNHGIYAQDTTGLTVSGSTVQHNGLHHNGNINEDKALQLDGVTNSTIKNNTVQNNLDDGAIGINDDGPITPGAPDPGPAQPVKSANDTVTGNNMPNNIGSGCDLVIAGYNAGGGTDHITVTGNQIVGHPGEVGPTGVFIGQIVVAGDGPGVSNTATTISGNTVVGSALAGIVLHANAPGDVIDGTVITGNTISLNHWATPFGPPQTTGVAIQAEGGPPGAVPVVSNTSLSGNTINQQYYAIWLKGNTPGTAIGANNISVTQGGMAVFHKPDAFSGYTMIGSDGGIVTFGRAQYTGSIPGSGTRTFGTVVGMAPTRDDNGYWIATTAGAVYDYGDATSAGSLLSTGVRPASPVAGIVATPAGGGGPGSPNGIGYYLFTQNGVVYAFGDATEFGSLPAANLTAPIVGLAVTPDGGGYWLVSSTGGVFSFGNARFLGSLAGKHLSPPIVGIAASPTGDGYYLVGADGGVFTYGDAHFYGSTGNLRLAAPVTGMVLGPQRPFAGPPPAGGPPPPQPAGGYALVARDGGVFTFGNAPYLGSGVGKHDGTGILGMAVTQ